MTSYPEFLSISFVRFLFSLHNLHSEYLCLSFIFYQAIFEIKISAIFHFEVSFELSIALQFQLCSKVSLMIQVLIKFGLRLLHDGMEFYSL